MKNKEKFIFISGPCVIESRQQTLKIAATLKDIASRYPVKFIFKASFDKANRTSIGSFRGPGIGEGIKILKEIKEKLQIPILSDIHSPEQAGILGKVLDIIQIPAFLCRQTDLVLAAAKTKKIINIKKGQFVSPEDVRYIIEKAASTGNKNILITERGSCFGYNNLVVDFRSFLIMKKFGYPVIFDATHSLQRPSAKDGVSGGDRQFVPSLSLAAAACGIDGIFMEVHPSPSKALSDKHTSYSLDKVESLIKKIMKVRKAVYEKT
ncbi:MAG: 3-deoxy-8-phosphooctulonate synthase [Candidatus Omnitrophica bacterium]|nr:3-deoxy-8-phosphooctulonate synthase [Candidatus Omnitrophota bacterium]MDD5430000.1 3-deoxy-8-phosphooctulonate synthase [Candidatus Omnitrophota bacterium]